MCEIISVAYLLFPIVIGAIFHGLCMKFSLLELFVIPIDHKKTFRGRRIFGKNKTYRGPIALGIGSIFGFFLQKELFHWWLPDIQLIEILDYENLSSVCFGFLLGFVTMLGELPNSFLKRQLGYSSGEAPKGKFGFFFFFLDQVDLLLGFWLVMYFFIPIRISYIIYSIIIVYVIHLLITYLAFYFGIRNTKR